MLVTFHFYRWDKLQKDSDIHRSRLQRNLDQFKKVLFTFNVHLLYIQKYMLDPG